MKEILYSPGYGAGWASWASNNNIGQFAAEYQPIIDYLKAATDESDLKRRRSDLKDENSEIIKQFFADLIEEFGEEFSEDPDGFYIGGGNQLTVTTVDGPYRIQEYDGSEWVETVDTINWYT